ncbi:LOB domain-containing protein 24-like [Impatiens glandulifera]|uniref:LOB domain-containing protein 24-like n=1 Tax=Impatiens glandulifera TaxID=253017 RepID=UPI001FB1367E|nr:LOB domain-containing protein 24-like [Impatiens glandulifera]
MSKSGTRCAACKYLRRRCSKDCIFAPYFPSNNPQRYDCVHKIFGANNVAKSLKDLPVHARAMAADCMSLEASWRIADPVYGCTGVITQLQDQIIKVQSELAKVQALSAIHLAQIQTIPYETQVVQDRGDVDGLVDQFVNEEVFKFDNV